uniref:C2H2-type domain-containing protein n=1 Tax=Lates calcarifer TaxID=8187 RepID=A0A4W6CRU4_LATCA
MGSNSKTKRPYKCSYCSRTFCKKIRLKCHHRGHKTNTLLLCSRCGQYYGFRKLNQHQKTCEGTAEPNTGSPNGNFGKSTSQTNQSVRKMPLQSNATKLLQLKCPYCTQRFRYRSILLRHIVSHTGVQPYACMHCGHRYGSQTMCLQHEAFCDGVYKEGASKVKNDTAANLLNIPTLREAAQKQAEGETEYNKEKKTVQYQCSECDKSFTDGLLLISHLEDHGRQEQEKKRNTCTQCGKVCASQGNLEKHMKMHGSEHKYPCPDCSKMAYSLSDLEIHRTCHDPNRPYACKLCSSRFWTRQSLKHDSDSAPYFPCHVCGKTFPTSESLEDHQRCHLGEKPHECEECGKCFFQASQLQQHQRMHKSEFQCQACGRGFVSLFALRKHKHTHGKSRPYRCSKCHFSFTGPSQLAEHMITHREENFPCDICNRFCLCLSWVVLFDIDNYLVQMLKM